MAAETATHGGDYNTPSGPMGRGVKNIIIKPKVWCVVNERSLFTRIVKYYYLITSVLLVGESGASCNGGKL